MLTVLRLFGRAVIRVPRCRKLPIANVRMLNAAAFAQPCEVGSNNTPTGCIPLPGVLALGGAQPTQIEGPGYRRLDFSLFKNFQLTERTRLEFRSEFFNILEPSQLQLSRFRRQRG